MSDKEGGAAAKRPKTNEHDAGGGHLARINRELTTRNDELTARIEELAARNEELAARNDVLESEIRVLRGEGKHGDSLLPVVIKRTTTASVDLSRVDPSLVAHVASFLGLSRELLSMALTCKAFGWRLQSSSTPGPSLVEETARQFLINQRPSDIERNALPQYGDGTTAWLPILHELEQLRLPLKFSKLVGRGLEYSGSESTVTSSYEDSSYEDYSTAFASYVMKRGVHYASFKLIDNGDSAIVGVARPFRDFDFVNEEDGFDMYELRHFGNILAQRTDAWVGNVHYCQLHCGNDEVDWNDLQEYKDTIYLEGFEGVDEGDVVGLLVDLNEGSLSVYKNGRRLGVAKDGLAGEYCFFSALSNGGVSIERESSPR